MLILVNISVVGSILDAVTSDAGSVLAQGTAVGAITSLHPRGPRLHMLIYICHQLARSLVILRPSPETLLLS